ncbi:nuclear transcription factor Y subunit C-1-like [Oryza brachyantha]|uniref:Core Histone H2A/H2B/H3 domain-containing protein n=1 Tax=Oryza brachyantha TaxID=4533 RepID=J3N1G8_ORYBR|nr:nuclear transcription factor Y subunit C-1-like [Oryza brachyantha]
MSIPPKEGVDPSQEDDTLSRLQLLAQQRRTMEKFWSWTHEQIEESSGGQELILPIARVKNVIHAEEGGMMLSADTPAFVTKLCEIFVQELILRAWLCADSHNREIILGTDIVEAITTTESYHFLGNVLRSHQALVSIIPDTDVSDRKRHKLNEMSSICPSPQEVQVPYLAMYLPQVLGCPIGQMGTHHTPPPSEFMMQREYLLKANNEKSPLVVTMNGSDVLASGGGASSDVSIDTKQGETAQPFSIQYTGHGHSSSVPCDENIKQLRQEEQNVDQDAVVGEDILPNKSLEGSHMDVDMVFPDKDIPQ